MSRRENRSGPASLTRLCFFSSFEKKMFQVSHREPKRHRYMEKITAPRLADLGNLLRGQRNTTLQLHFSKALSFHVHYLPETEKIRRPVSLDPNLSVQNPFAHARFFISPNDKPNLSTMINPLRTSPFFGMQNSRISRRIMGLFTFEIRRSCTKQ